ncbi:MAG: MmcQ-like protein [Salinivirgaceae bacterium]|nr:MAG: MmcQ-like protein [Salinivirgaceae bacterium]
MDSEKIRTYCLFKTFVTEGFPFNETALVFKVAGKMFAILDLEAELRVSLKCDPEKALELREQFSAIRPGYHLNKQHWNTIYFDGSISQDLVYSLIDHSYDLVVSKLTKKTRVEIYGKDG